MTINTRAADQSSRTFDMKLGEIENGFQGI